MIGRISSTVFVGREQELARLAELAASADGAALATRRFALIGGDAGIGKTRLVTEFTAALDGTQVLTGGCLQLGAGASPLAPVTEILRALTHERGEDRDRRLLAGPREALAGLLSQTGNARERGPLGGPDASQLHEAVLSLLAALAEERPLVVVLEDLHWAAPAMLDLVTFLARNPLPGPVLLVGTFRADELHRRHPLRPVLADLSRLGTVERIDLEPLTAAEQQRQAEAILGRSLTGAEVANLTRSEGNAFFVEELVSSPATASGALPATLRDVLTDRLAALPGDADEVVRVAAAAGRTVDHRLLEAVADLDADALQSGLRAAVEHRVLVPEDHSYRFRHALLQEAAYDELLPGERLRLHRDLANALAATRDLAADGTTADAEIAHHADQAMLPDLAYPASLAAADGATRVYAFEEALRHVERALTLRDSCATETRAEGPSRQELLRRAAGAAAAVGEPHRAVGYYESALADLGDQADPVEIAEIHNSIALTHKDTDDIDLGLAANDRALAVAPERSAQRAYALASRALYVAVRKSRPAEAVEPAEAAVRMARDLHDPEQEAFALFALGTVRGVLGQLDEAVPLMHAAIDLAVSEGRMEEATLTCINLGSCLAGAGRTAEAQALEADWLRRCEDEGYLTTQVGFLRCNHIMSLVNSGHPIAAADHLAKVRIQPQSSVSIAMYLQAAFAVLLAQARFTDAARLAHDHRAAMHDIREPQFRLGFVEAEALIAVADGRHNDAWDYLDGVRHLPQHQEEYEPVRPLAARVEADRLTRGPVDDDTGKLSMERFDLLRQDLHDMLAEADDSPLWTAHVRTALAQVGAERTRAEGKPDPDAWLAAEEGVAAQGRVAEVAYLRIRRAEALAGVGRRDDATELLQQTHADCVGRGMVWCTQQAEAIAKRTRIRLPGLVTPGGDPFGLTARERDVLALLAEGLTNPQIGERLVISGKTASVHVSHILAKLDAGNRNRAAAIARDHGLVGGP